MCDKYLVLQQLQGLSLPRFQAMHNLKSTFLKWEVSNTLKELGEVLASMQGCMNGTEPVMCAETVQGYTPLQKLHTDHENVRYVQQRQQPSDDNTHLRNQWRTEHNCRHVIKP